MKKQQYEVLGVMSGTSLDGIDLAHCVFTISESEGWHFEIRQGETIPYSAQWKRKLQEGIHLSTEGMSELNTTYTLYLNGVISEFILENKLLHLDAICSHGHTICHQPAAGFTLQIGNLPSIAQGLPSPVVCDFRVQDVAFGGQGAPLVPIGDRLLFASYDYCLNLGGFANCSFEENGSRLAYDICPVNIVLNHFAELLGHPFDAGGKLAASGKVNTPLLETLNALPFYTKAPPKSLGLEWVQQHIFPIMQTSKICLEDKLCTFTEHVALQLAAQFEEESSVLISGGGAYNDFLLERLSHHKNLSMEVPNPTIIEFKEALVFGLLGVLKLRGEVNCLASVTGATRDHSSGVMYP